MKIRKDHAPRIWIFMADSRSIADLRDLDHLDAILWGANPNARRGDLVLMYRTAPYSDIPYVFVAGSDPRPTQAEDHADTTHVIELVNKIRLVQPVSLAQIKTNPQLSRWSFAAYQQGAMRRRQDIKQEGVWSVVRRMLVAGNPQLTVLLRKIDAPQSESKGSDLARSVPRPDHTSYSGRLGRQARRRKLGRLRIFVSYASEDFRRVRRLQLRLRAEPDFEPWLDKSNIFVGDDWKDVINKAIGTSDAVVICLSSYSFRKIGFVQTEIGWALKMADQRPEGTTFIIPAKLEPCEVPRRLSKWQWAELFKKGGYEHLTTSLRKRIRDLRSLDRPTTPTDRNPSS